LVEQDEDEWLVGSVVELPGCHTQARTSDELMIRIKEAVETYLDVQEISQEKIEFVRVKRRSEQGLSCFFFLVHWQYSTIF